MKTHRWDEDAVRVSAAMLASSIDEVAEAQGVKRRVVIAGLAETLGVPYARIEVWTNSGIPDGKTREAVWKFIEREL